MNLYATLERRALAKGYRRVPVSSIQQWRKDGEYKKFPVMYLGGISATCPQEKIKFIDENHYPIPYTELAREYLEYIFEQASTHDKRVGWRKATLPMVRLNVPWYFARPVTGPLAYVDIVSAFYQIYSPLTYDLRFCTDPLYVGRGRLEFLEHEQLARNKLVRNVIVGGIARSMGSAMWVQKHGKVKRVNTINKFLAPELWGYIAHTLNAVAYECINLFDCFYWHTDGAILPLENAFEMMDYLWDKWKLEAAISGWDDNGKLYGFGSHAIGVKSTRNKHRTTTPIPLAMGYDENIADKLKLSRLNALGRRVALL